ncbi:hypothetical protein AAFG13_42600 [Bradyrhizobium sp. B124]|uniref:hypothetical protein n=1 Tax=Bradyrhizobium sp. B124 TaxID=3140245 RepID=UPI0031843DB8
MRRSGDNGSSRTGLRNQRKYIENSIQSTAAFAADAIFRDTTFSQCGFFCRQRTLQASPNDFATPDCADKFGVAGGCNRRRVSVAPLNNSLAVIDKRTVAIDPLPSCAEAPATEPNTNAVAKAILAIFILVVSVLLLIEQTGKRGD